MAGWCTLVPRVHHHATLGTQPPCGRPPRRARASRAGPFRTRHARRKRRARLSTVTNRHEGPLGRAIVANARPTAERSVDRRRPRRAHARHGRPRLSLPNRPDGPVWQRRSSGARRYARRPRLRPPSVSVPPFTSCKRRVQRLYDSRLTAAASGDSETPRIGAFVISAGTYQSRRFFLSCR